MTPATTSTERATEMNAALTEKEAAVLKTLRAITEGDGGKWGSVYLDHLASESGLNGPALAGVLGSLKKKGLYAPGDGPEEAGWGFVLIDETAVA